MADLYVPLAQVGPGRPRSAMALAGGWAWFTHARKLGGDVTALRDLPGDLVDRLTSPRPAIGGLSMDRPRLMGIVNVTPDSFSDGGQFNGPDAAHGHGLALARHGADILDIGGESTRPGAHEVPVPDEIDRTAPVIAGLRAEWQGAISIDTRKGAVAQAALDAGATMVNDVSALRFDSQMARLVADSGAPICLMHAQGDPATMQTAPHYDDVIREVYGALDQRIAGAEAAGIPRDRIVVDPGIGFGKTVAHNLALLSHLAVFHGLGCPILLGASRKRFIGTLGGAESPADRVPGSIAVGLAALAQGVQILRVHDIAETRQATTLWMAATEGHD